MAVARDPALDRAAILRGRARGGDADRLGAMPSDGLLTAAPGRRALQRRPRLGLRARRGARRRPPRRRSATSPALRPGRRGAAARRPRRRTQRRRGPLQHPRSGAAAAADQAVARDGVLSIRSGRNGCHAERTGEVIERDRQGGRVFALRFRAYGQRHFVTLGGAADGWTRAEGRGRAAPRPRRRRARACGRRTSSARGRSAGLARRSTSSPRSGSRRAEPSCARATIADYTWQLSNHLLPFFHRHRLPQITVAEVDRYRDFKVREQRPLRRVDQQDDHPARPDPRRRRGARPDPAQPGPRQHAQPQAQDQAQAAGLPRLGRADRRDDRRRHRARRQAGGAHRRPPRAHRDARLRRPAHRRGDGARVAATSTSPTAGSRSATPRPRPASAWSTSSRRCATS